MMHARERPLKITFLTWRDTGHPDGGGSEIFVERMAEGLVGRGHEVTLFTARYEGSRSDEVRRGVRYVRRGGRLSVYPRGLLLLLGRDGRDQDAIVEVINGLPFASRLVRRRGLTALVHHLHRQQWHMIYPGLGGRIGWAVESRGVPRLYRDIPFVTVSGPTREDLRSLGIPGGNITVVHNGVAPRSEARPEKSPTPRLSILGRLVPHKQVEHALDLVASMRRRGLPVELDVVGAGWWADRLAHHAETLSIEDLVHFHGHVTDGERDRILARAWLNVLPSVKEGWGLAILDAAAMGTATVAYRSAGGVRESIEDGVTGVLAEDRADFFAIVESMIRAGVSPCTDMGRDARIRASRYSWDEAVTAFERAISPCRRR